MDNNLIWNKVLADPYSSYNTERSDWQDIYDWILPLAHGEVLDVGCGLGHLSNTLMKSPNVLWTKGVDISSVAIEEARRRLPNSYFMVEDIEQSSRLQDGHYDCVCFTQVLEHIANDRGVIASIPTGKDIFISVPKETAHNHESHVHFFDSMEALEDRYKDLIDIALIEQVGESQFLCLYGKRNDNGM